MSRVGVVDPPARAGAGLDVICACATAWGHAAVALLRLSGPDARAVVERLCPGGARWQPRRATLRTARQGDEVLDEVLVTWMPGPGSYTGEDVVELGCHGNPVIVERLLDALVAAGARPARPGEFTRRAVVNGRMDLVAAESVAGLVGAGSWEGVLASRSGGAAAEAELVRAALLDLASELEVRLDHPDDDLSLLDDGAVVSALADLAGRARRIAATWTAGRMRVEGARVALVGPVNAGKSSLFNRLVGSNRALVSPTPGTTRDVVERSVLLDGLEVTWLDTAGQRSTDDPLEAAGLALADELTADVDLLVVVLPLAAPAGGLAPDPAAIAAVVDRTAGRGRVVVGSHLDLVGQPGARGVTLPVTVDHRTSATTGAGVAELEARIRSLLGSRLPSGAGAVLGSQRQHELFLAIAEECDAASEALSGPTGPAVAAEHLTRALGRLDELEGRDTREAVLDRVFARFCIGK